MVRIMLKVVRKWTRLAENCGKQEQFYDSKSVVFLEKG